MAGMGKIVREAMEGAEKKIINSSEDIAQSSFKRFSGKKAELVNIADGSLERKTMEQSKMFEANKLEADRAKFDADRVQKQINKERVEDNVHNWRQKEQDFYNNRSKANSTQDLKIKNESTDMNEILGAEDRINKYANRNERKVLKQEANAARIERKAADPGNEAVANEMGKAWGGGNKMGDTTAGAAAQEKNGLTQKMDGFLKKAVPIAVGGGLVLSMFNRGGQMSNSELYGQQQYGGQGY